MKRRRTARGYIKTRRQYNKNIPVIQQNPTTTQSETIIGQVLPGGAPRTFKLGRVSISAIGESTQSTLVRWAIIKVPEGRTLNALDPGTGSDLYTPESDVLTFGTMALADSDSGTGSTTVSQNFRVRASRKMQEGDRLYFVSDTNNTNAISLIAIVQYVELL